MADKDYEKIGLLSTISKLEKQLSGKDFDIKVIRMEINSYINSVKMINKATELGADPPKLQRLRGVSITYVCKRYKTSSLLISQLREQDIVNNTNYLDLIKDTMAYKSKARSFPTIWVTQLLFIRIRSKYGITIPKDVRQLLLVWILS